MFNIKLPAVLILFAFAFLAFRAFGLADLSTTELIKVEGNVEVRKGQTPEFKKVPSNLQLAGALKRLDGGDKVRTAAQSGAELMLKDTCVLAVKEGSLFEVPLVLGAKGISQLKAQQGNFLFKVLSGSDFKVQTADVVAAVKGTLFEVEMTDNFQRIMQLPGVEIGIDNLGGTMIDVYEGEVELTNQEAKTTKRLKAGEGISVFNRSLMRLDKLFSGGFSDIRRFKPLEQVGKNFGKVGQLLGSIGSSRQGFAGLNTQGLSMPFQRANLGGRIQKFMDGFAPGLQGKLKQFRGKLGFLDGLKGELKGWEDIGNAIKGENFKPNLDSSAFPMQTRTVIIPENAVVESRLGEGLFVAGGPAQGCQVVRLSPVEGHGLTLDEGEGTFRIRDFASKLDGTVVVHQAGDQVVTVVEMKEGTLNARLTGDVGSIAVPSGGKLAFAVTTANGVARRMESVPAVPVNDRVINHPFRAESEIKRQRDLHDQKEVKKKLETGVKIKDKVKNRPGILKQIPKFKNFRWR